MQLGIFLVIAAVIHGLLGLTALLAPAAVAGMVGIALDAGGAAIARLLGATLLGVAATFWFSRSLVPADVLRAVLIGGFVVSALSLVVAVLALSGGVIGPKGWIGAAVRLLLTIGFGYFAFMKQAEPDAKA